MQNVNLEVFTREEQEVLNKLIEMGERDNLAQGVLEMTPAKEIELQKIADQMRPVAQEFESEELKKYKEERMAKGEEPYPQTPAEEAALQKILDDEMKAEQEKQKKISDERAGKLAEVVKPIAPTEVKAPFCDSCESKGVRHLKACPKFK